MTTDRKRALRVRAFLRGFDVLVVDADSVDAARIADIVARAGGTCRSATTMLDALRTPGDPAVVLIAMDIPHVDGVDLLHALRRQAGYGLHAIAITKARSERIALIESGFTGAIARPIETDALIQALHGAAKRRADGDATRQASSDAEPARADRSGTTFATVTEPWPLRNRTHAPSSSSGASFFEPATRSRP